jgi:hypothetical protein
MNKILFVFILCISTNLALAFETGDYHGESRDHQQICDFNLIQNPASITVKKFECIDTRTYFDLLLLKK